MATTGATAGASAAAAVANAIKASGVLVRVSPEEFRRVLDRIETPLIVVAGGPGLFRGGYKYLTSYRGLAFHTKSPDPIELPGAAELVTAKSIAVPG